MGIKISMEIDREDVPLDELHAAHQILERLEHGCHYEGAKMMPLPPSEVQKYMEGMVQLRRNMGNPPKHLKYCCIEEFVLKEGRFMGSRSKLSDDFPLDPMKQCFGNAYRRMMHKKLHYCEGFASTGIIPVHHAWLVDMQGNVIDTTWVDGLEYYGVEFETEYVIGTVLARGCYGVIDNFQFRFPLLRGEEVKFKV
jgi:hypothetical protein